MLMTKMQSVLYKRVFKPLAFRFDPEAVHDRMTAVGRWMGRHTLIRRVAHRLWAFEHPTLKQDLLGIHFPNPVGLTAGFDKDGYLIDILPDLGFGFAEIGSITGQPCQGNPKPRLWRLPNSESLVVNYGLKNEGATAIYKRLQDHPFRLPIGINVAKTNAPETCDVEIGINDYLISLRTFAEVGDYFTINISCPNAYGGEPFTSPELLERLLTAADRIQTSHPIFLKMPADLSFEETDALVEVAVRHRIQGLILCNLTKRRDRDGIQQEELERVGKGGLSGRPTFDASTHILAHLYRTAGDRLILVGTGGIFTAEDAYQKIRAGASLVQLATGMIFRGPQLIGELNRGLVELLTRDGFSHIHEAIGVDHDQYHV